LKAGVEYNSLKLRVKELINLRTFKQEGSLTYLASDNFAIGVNEVFDLKTTNLENFDFGFNWVPSAGAQVGLRHESPKKKENKDKLLEFGKFFLLFSHAASANQTVGTEFSLDWSKKLLEARLGLLHRFNEDTYGKFKVNHNGYLNALVKHNVNKNLTVTLATGLNLKQVIETSKTQALPVGIAVDLKF